MVTHDKEKWEGTAGDLSKIPEKIRPEVEGLLHHPGFELNNLFARAGEGIVTVVSGEATLAGAPIGVPPPAFGGVVAGPGIVLAANIREASRRVAETGERASPLGRCFAGQDRKEV